jgi:copper resistance protein D
MKLLYLLSVWSHLLAAMLWIGGMLFLVLVLVPFLRRPEYRQQAPVLLHWTGLRFRWLGWLCFALLIVSGTFNLAYRGFGWADVVNGRLWQGPFGQTLAIKLLLVAVILLLSAAHDFVIGPRATDVWRTNPADPAVQRLRRQASWFGRLNLLLGLLVVFLAVMLVRGWPGG